jgi:hypothetical protein
MKLVRLLLATSVALLVLMGCTEKQDLTRPNLLPETYVSLADTVRNPTVYIQIVNWWGDDKDGEVIGYEYRWSSDPEQPGCSLAADWVFTEETSIEFHLPVTADSGTHTIEVRAMDDEGEVDETPARLTLPVTNTRPKVKIWDKGGFPDTTYPAFYMKWHGDDPEGPETIRAYKLWLDGEEEEAEILSPNDTAASLGYESFEERYGQRTVSIVAIDSGCDTSDVTSYTWYVKAPVGNLLMVDDIARSHAGNDASDQFYRGALDSCVGTYSVLDIDRFGGSATYVHNFPELLALFDMVVWYNDPLRPGTENLSLAEGSLEDYLEAGGRFLLVSLGAVGNSGALLDSLAFEMFGIESLYMSGKSTNFDCKRWKISPNAGLGLDTVKVSGLYPGVECMLPKSQATQLFHIPPGVARPDTVDYYLGVMNSWKTGKAALLTFPMSRADTYGNARSSVCKVIHLRLQ